MKRIATAVLLSFFVAAAGAEPLFISDKLVVSVYAEANQDSEKLTTLDSGDAVEALEKAEGYTKVKLSDGREGWVRSSYLVGQAPAVVRLKELEKERSTAPSAASAATSEELKQLKEQNASLNEQVRLLKNSTVQSSPLPAPQPAAVPSSTGNLNTPLPVHVLKWGGAIALCTGIVGFALGYRTLAKRIERKYGKLKIY